MDSILPKILPRFPHLVLGIALETWVRYFVFAGIAWLLAFVWFRKRWWRRKIIQRLPSSGDMRREMGWSALTAVIYGLVGAVTLWLAWFGWTQIYFKIGQHSRAWFWSSIVIGIFVHDAYFYWTHRLMHHPRLFRWFHRVHHESTNPSPWAAYCFGPLEAVVQAGIFPLLVCIMPMHLIAFMLFMFWQIFFNVLGHTGFEYYPRWLIDSWVGKFLNTPTHHVQHHEKLRGNYGLYFNYWDRLFGTNNPGYEARFREVTRREG
jgi:sterol desaturase/sphingolipid hydroxylase (fatty acid hydroxylase superfamily)